MPSLWERADPEREGCELVWSELPGSTGASCCRLGFLMNIQSQGLSPRWNCPLCPEPLPAPDDLEQRLFRGLEKPFLEEQLWGFLLCVVLQGGPQRRWLLARGG